MCVNCYFKIFFSFCNSPQNKLNAFYAFHYFVRFLKMSVTPLKRKGILIVFFLFSIIILYYIIIFRICLSIFNIVCNKKNNFDFPNFFQVLNYFIMGKKIYFSSFGVREALQKVDVPQFLEIVSITYIENQISVVLTIYEINTIIYLDF